MIFSDDTPRKFEVKLIEKWTCNVKVLRELKHIKWMLIGKWKSKRICKSTLVIK